MTTVIPFPYHRESIDKGFKELIIRYLEGDHLIKKPYGRDTSLSIEDELKRLCTSMNHASIDAKTLCHLVDVTAEGQFDKDIIAILNHLEMPTEIEDYIGSTASLYDLLSRLRNEGHERLDSLLELIENTRYKRNWRDHLTTPALTMLGIVTFCYGEPDLFWNALDWVTYTTPLIYHWFYQHIVEFHNLPILGMIGQVGWGLHYLINTFEYGFNQSDKRIRNWMFNTLAVMLNFSAHLISYWAAGALPLLPAFVFILSAWVDIVKNFYNTWQEKTPTPNQQSSRHRNATCISMAQIKARDKQILIANCIHAAAVTTLILASYFLTPSIILTITYTLAIWIGLFMKDRHTKKIQQIYANEIQKKLRDHYKSASTPNEASDREDFGHYAQKLLSKIEQNSQKLLGCTQFKDVLLKVKPFYLLHSKQDFKSFCNHWDFIAIKNQPLTPLPMIRKNRKHNPISSGLFDSHPAGSRESSPSDFSRNSMF